MFLIFQHFLFWLEKLKVKHNPFLNEFDIFSIEKTSIVYILNIMIYSNYLFSTYIIKNLTHLLFKPLPNSYAIFNVTSLSRLSGIM
jgi:hypothetical protein